MRSVSVEGTHQRVDRKEYGDSAGVDQPWVDLIRQRIVLKGDLTEEQRERIEYIAGRCPVHRTLQNAPVIEEEVEVVA